MQCKPFRVAVRVCNDIRSLLPQRKRPRTGTVALPPKKQSGASETFDVAIVEHQCVVSKCVLIQRELINDDVCAV
jgi:hypothetical protein